MKSTDTDLKKRGFVSENEYTEIIGVKNFQIDNALFSKEVYLRTAAIRMLKTRKDEKYVVHPTGRICAQNRQVQNVE
jgi:hypothetical protein